MSTNLLDTSTSLHGLYLPDQDSGAAVCYVSFYCHLCKAMVDYQEESRRRDPVFSKGFWPLANIMFHMTRSIELLGIAHDEYIKIFTEGTTTRHWIDISISADSIMYYMRVMADCIAKTMPLLFFSNPAEELGNDRHSFRDLRIKAMSFPDHHPFRHLFLRNGETTTEWFDFLAARGHGKKKGKRDARTHDGATHSPVGPFMETESGTEHVTIKLKTKFGNISLSDDLIGEISNAFKGMMAFLDHLSRAAVRQDAVFNLQVSPYSRWGLSPAYGVSDFVRRMVPLVRPALAQREERPKGDIPRTE